MAEKLKNKVTDGFQKGHPYGELPPCIHVGILNFNQMISPNYYHKFCLMDEKTKEIYSRKFQWFWILYIIILFFSYTRTAIQTTTVCMLYVIGY